MSFVSEKRPIFGCGPRRGGERGAPRDAKFLQGRGLLACSSEAVTHFLLRLNLPPFRPLLAFFLPLLAQVVSKISVSSLKRGSWSREALGEGGMLLAAISHSVLTQQAAPREERSQRVPSLPRVGAKLFLFVLKR